ncbi:protein STU1-like [Triticum dicoccoides]|uniref:protein STU1-like n=1 Tax=Triticum dicoccoides TaxID=85692 RepID=UPI00188DE77F|nr:protein STU1-like [Triticum dicoccoides]
MDPRRRLLSLDPARRRQGPRLKTTKPWILGAIAGRGSWVPSRAVDPGAPPPSSDPAGRRRGSRLKMPYAATLRPFATATSCSSPPPSSAPPVAPRFFPERRQEPPDSPGSPPSRDHFTPASPDYSVQL